MATTDELLVKANELIEEKNYKGVIDLLPEEVLKELKSDGLYAEKARAYYRLKEYDLCLEAAETALAINPKNAKAHHYIGHFYSVNGQYEMAVIEYQKAIECDPIFSFPYNGLGYAYNKLQQYEKANDAFILAIKYNPKFTRPYNNLGNYSRRLKEYDKAIEFYNEAIKIDPKYSDSYYNRALTYFDQGQYEKALLDFEKKIELTKDNPDYYTSLAKEKIAEIGKLINDQAYSDINMLVNKVKGVLLYEDDCITHYTSMTVAKALILDKDSKFRLSEGTYLNDTSEGKELFDYLKLSAPAADGQTTVIENFIRKPFIGSFVAENKHNDLTLWRMYGKEDKDEARGCSITMQREELIKEITESLPGYKKEDALKADSEFIFYRVAYRKQDDRKPFTIPSGTNEDEEALNDYMQKLVSMVQDFKERRLDKPADMQKLWELLNEIAYLFKSYDYQYEHEVRLVLKGTGFEKIVDTRFTPPKVYIELVNLLWVITKITLGPKVERAEEWVSAFYYGLYNAGLSADILISHLPFK